MEKKKKNVLLWFIAVILFLFNIFLCLIGYFSYGFRGFDIEQKNDLESIDNAENINVGDFVINGLMLSTASANTNNLITASVDGPEGIDKSLSWTSYWYEENTWTSNKKVEDYLKLTVNSDTHSVLVEALMPFNSPIIVKAMSNSRVEIFATCTINYIKKIQTISSNTKFDAIPVSYDNKNFSSIDSGLSFSYTEGTMTPEIYYSVTYQYSPKMMMDIQNALNNNQISARINRKKTKPLVMNNNVSLGINISGDILVDESNQKAKDLINDMLIENANNLDWGIEVSIKYYVKKQNITYQTKEYNMGSFKFDVNTLIRKNASSIELDKQEVIL